ncbi:MAG: Bacterial regulatory protein lacI family, partial [Frankiales bacterium]|nr:Bacterial regulatory protein lacI family [Frankiales bacterium]
MAHTVRRGFKLDDLARMAGVSRSTASRALTGAGSTSATARAAVLSAAETLGY